MAVARHAGLGDVPRAEIIGGGERAHGGAVIGVPSGDELMRARLHAVQQMILLGRLERHLVGFGARAGEHAGREGAGRELGDLGGEVHGYVDDVGESAAVMQADELVVDRLGDAVLAVAERRGAGLRAHHVEIGLARRVGDLEALRRDEDGGAVGAHFVLAREREEIMIERVLRERVDIGQIHGAVSLFFALILRRR